MIFEMILIKNLIFYILLLWWIWLSLESYSLMFDYLVLGNDNLRTVSFPKLLFSKQERHIPSIFKSKLSVTAFFKLLCFFFLNFSWLRSHEQAY